MATSPRTAAPTQFAGFGPKTLKFLADLGRNNEKSWFEAHRSEYEQLYLEPAKAFVEAVGPKIAKFAPAVVWEPRVNGSIFRVNRDIRFSKDKTPYKNHIDVWFWEGDRKTALSGFYLRIRDKTIHLGAGSHGFSKDALARYRRCMHDEQAVRALGSLIKRLGRAGYSVEGKTYKQAPRGFDGIGVATELVLYGGLSAGVERKSPPELGRAEFVTYCAREWKKLAPLHRWLMDNIG